MYLVKNGGGNKTGRSSSTADGASYMNGGGYDQYAPLQQRKTRRMNAWQQDKDATAASIWDEAVPTGGVRRGRRGPVSYAEPDMSFLDDLE